jgi:hypothetical protein
MLDMSNRLQPRTFRWSPPNSIRLGASNSLIHRHPPLRSSGRLLEYDLDAAMGGVGARRENPLQLWEP